MLELDLDEGGERLIAGIVLNDALTAARGNVRLVKERGVSVVQASRDLDVGESILRRWIKELWD